MSNVMDKSEKGPSVSKEFALFNLVQWDIPDLPFVRNKEWQY